MTVADPRPALRFYVLADAAIASIVGIRMFAGRMPQGEIRTSIVFTRVSGVGDHHLQGPSGLARARFQIDAWAQTLDAAVALADLIKARIDGFRGTIQWDDNSPGNALTIQGIFFESESEDYDDTAKLYRARRDYFVNYDER